MNKFKEVKRIVKPDEFIKIVQPEMSGDCYKIGDVMKVERIERSGVYVYPYSNKHDPVNFIAHNEYVVLEPIEK